MKSHSCNSLLPLAVLFATAHFLPAVTLLDDNFDDGDLATNTSGIGGGFVEQGNGVATPGSVTEVDSMAKIVEGTLNNTYGIRSINAFDLSDPGTTYTATWEVAAWVPSATGATTDLRRIFLALQTNDSWLFAGGASESRIIVEINRATGNCFLQYQMRTGTTNTNYNSQDFPLGTFTGDPDGFTATLTFDSTGFAFTTVGLNAANEVNLTGTWEGLGNGGTSFATVAVNDGPMHIAAYMQDNGNPSASQSLNSGRLNIGRITLGTSSGTGPLMLKILRNGANLDFEWNSRSGKIYKLVSSTDLSTPVSTWPIYDDGVDTCDNILPSGSGTNTLTGVIPLGPARFFAVEESDAPVPPPVYFEDFETGDGGFTQVGTPNDWQWGTPNSDNATGLVLTSGNDDSTNCWGTNLGTGGSPSGLINPGADSILRSPEIDLTGVVGAQLRFAAAYDAKFGDAIEVRVYDAVTETLLDTIKPVAVPVPDAYSDWTDLGPFDLPAADSGKIHLEFRFAGTDGNYIGFYIDDVSITAGP